MSQRGKARVLLRGPQPWSVTSRGAGGHARHSNATAFLTGSPRNACVVAQKDWIKTGKGLHQFNDIQIKTEALRGWVTWDLLIWLRLPCNYESWSVAFFLAATLIEILKVVLPVILPADTTGVVPWWQFHVKLGHFKGCWNWFRDRPGWCIYHTEALNNSEWIFCQTI